MTARGGGDGSRQGLRGPGFNDAHGLSGGDANGGGIFRRESEASYQAAHSASSFSADAPAAAPGLIYTLCIF